MLFRSPWRACSPLTIPPATWAAYWAALAIWRTLWAENQGAGTPLGGILALTAMYTALQEEAMAHVGCGIDIGGSGVKGALVDLDSGEFIGERVRIETPQPSTPEAVAAVCAEVLDRLGAPQDIAVGVSFPAPIIRGVVRFMANLDQSWTGVDVNALLSERLGRRVHTLNDADAAGLAEVAYGAAKDHPGTVIVTTLGTGIGSAVIVDGTLVPNTELGHLEINGHDAETRASSGQREAQGLSWKKWAKRNLADRKSVV
mgnify:CR=1 FL=1